MKKNIVTITILFVICSIILIMYNRKKFNSDFLFGVIETTQSESNSYITYYDSDFNITYRQKLPYSEICDTSYDNIPFQSNKLYFAPTDGDWEGKNDLISISLLSGETHIYNNLPDELDLDKYITVDSNNIYINSNLNNDSYLYSISLDEKETNYISEKEDCFSEMISDDEHLYIFNHNMDLSKRKIYIYNCDNLTKSSEINLEKNYGGSPFLFEKKLYFLTSDIEDQKHVYLGNIDTKTQKETYIDCGSLDFSGIRSNIINFNQYLLFVISSERSNSVIYIYDTKTKKSYTYKLNENNIFQLAVKGNYVYALSYNNLKEEGYLYKYSFEHHMIKLNNKHDVYTQKDKKCYYYVSGFFVNYNCCK